MSGLWRGAAATGIAGGSSGEENITTNYKHKLTDTVVEFNTPVTCGVDLTCADLTANSIYGNAAVQVQSLIDTAVTNAYPYWVAGKIMPTELLVKIMEKLGFQ